MKRGIRHKGATAIVVVAISKLARSNSKYRKRRK